MNAIKPPLPAGTGVGFAYEYGLDIDLNYPGAPTWQNVRRATAIAPTTPPITEPAETYDDFGAPNADKTSESWAVSFGVQVNRLASGLYTPEVEAFKAYTEPDAIGELAVAHVRWYDKPVSGAPNPGDAYEGLCTVAIDRGNTGNTGVGQWTITLTGKGKRTKIANPFTGWGAAAPTISAVTPAGQTVDEQVRIDGTNFVGVTGITIDTVTVDEYTVVSSTTIVAVIPATVAGAAPIIVTNATGSSAAYPYTAA